MGKEKDYKMKNDNVVIKCYGKEERRKRKDAIKFYLECMMYSEGCERDRYTNIYLQLLSGQTYCNDEQDY